MGEYTYNFPLDPEIEKLIREMYKMLQNLDKSRRRRISDKLISSKELRQELGISAKTEYTYRKKGILKGKKIGSRWYYDPSEIVNLAGDS